MYFLSRGPSRSVFHLNDLREARCRASTATLSVWLRINESESREKRVREGKIASVYREFTELSAQADRIRAAKNGEGGDISEEEIRCHSRKRRNAMSLKPLIRFGEGPGVYFNVGAKINHDLCFGNIRV